MQDSNHGQLLVSVLLFRKHFDLSQDRGHAGRNRADREGTRPGERAKLSTVNAPERDERGKTHLSWDRTGFVGVRGACVASDGMWLPCSGFGDESF